jgi:hypothetical protein
MKINHWFNLYGWPALALIIFLSLLGGLFVLLGRQSAPRGLLSRAAVVRYAPRNNAPAVDAEEIAEIRALYASDLFASARGNRFSVSPMATNRLIRAPVPPSAAPLFLSFPPATNRTIAEAGIAGKLVLGNADVDSPASRRPSGQAAGLSNQTPVVSITLKGDLKNLSLAPDVFRGLDLSAGRAWSVQAEVRIDNAGRVAHVLAEPQDCAPELYREIVKRLYQCNFTNATRACRGEIVIGYPVYSATNQPASAASLKE